MDEPSQPAPFTVGESVRPDPHRGDPVAHLRLRPRRPDPALQRRLRAGDRVHAARRCSAATRATFVIPPEEREAFGEFLAYVWKTGTPSPQVGHWHDQGRRPAADRVVEQADGRRRTASRASLVTSGIDLTDRAPRAEDERALEGDPEAKLAEIGRLASEQRALRRVATLVASEVRPERVFIAVSEECARVLRSTPRRCCATRATARRRASAATTATASTSSGRREPARRRGRGGRPRPAHGRARAGRRLGRPRRDGRDDFRTGYRSTAAAPIVVAGGLWGAVAIASEDPLPPESREPARRRSASWSRSPWPAPRRAPT